MRERLEEAVREVAAEFLSREANRQSLITVTAARLRSDGRSGTIYITVYPESAEQQALQFANRHRRELGKFFAERIKGSAFPRVVFEIDHGEKNRQRLDELSS